jgi:hypothetical protein
MSWPCSCIRATILRAWPGWTRSSRVEVVNSVRGYFASLLTFWYGEYFCRNAQSSGLSGSPYSPIHEAPASSLL